MEQNNANNQDACQRVGVGGGVDRKLNDQPPAGGVEHTEPVIDGIENGGKREEDLNGDANVQNHMATRPFNTIVWHSAQWLKHMVFDMKLLRLQQVMTPLLMLLKPEWVQQQPNQNLLTRLCFQD